MYAMSSGTEVSASAAKIRCAEASWSRGFHLLLERGLNGEGHAKCRT
jgi:hypothetical protein